MRSRSTNDARSKLTAALAILTSVAALAFVPSTRPTALMRDFAAFYCAGRAIDRGADPYRAEPLGACEREPKPPGLDRGIAGLSVPAPLPPVALAGFAVLARLPYGIAAGAWTLVLLGAFSLAILALRRLGVAPATAIPALGLTDGYASLALGQIAPIAIAALLVAAVELEARPKLAGTVAAIALVEPHLALPALMGVALRRRASLPALLLVALAAAGLGLVVCGPATNAEYVHSVLPSHARSELGSTRQFSLTTILVEFHVAPEPARLLGDASYVIAGGAGIAVGMVLSARFGPALAIVAPMAFAVAGGPFVHIVQMAAAMPLGLILAVRQTAYRRALVVAIVATSSPWVQFASLGDLFVPLAAAAAGAVVLALGQPLRGAALAAVAAIALICGIEALVTERPPDATPALVARADPRALAEESWTRYVAIVGGADRRAYDLARWPTWLGTFAIVAIATRLALGEKGSARSPRSRTPIASRSGPPHAELPSRKDPP